MWATSWGASTRLIGATIMSHSDDTGLVLPPAVAPTQVVVLPIITKQAADREPALLAAAEAVAARLQGRPVASAASAAAATAGGAAAAAAAVVDRFASWLPPPSAPPVRVAVDADLRTPPGARYFAWERAGVPLRLEIGPRDLDAGTVTARTRVAVPLPVAGLEVVAAATAAPAATSAGPAPAPQFGDRFTLRADGSLPAAVMALLAAVQRQLFANALARTASNVVPVASADELYAIAAEHAAGAAQADLHDHDDAPVSSSVPASSAAAAPAATVAALAHASAAKAAAAASGKGGKSSGKGGKGNSAAAASAAPLQPLRPHPWVIAPLADDPAVDAALKERRLTVRCFPAALPEAHCVATSAYAADAAASAASSALSAAVIDDDSSHRTWAAVLAAALARPDASPAAVAAVRDGLAGRGRCIVTGREGCRVAIIGRAF